MYPTKQRTALHCTTLKRPSRRYARCCTHVTVRSHAIRAAEPDSMHMSGAVCSQQHAASVYVCMCVHVCDDDDDSFYYIQH